MKINIKELKRIVKESIDDFDERDEIASIYSDVYKEKYGIRPRHMNWDEMSTEEMKVELESLYDVAGDDWEEEETYEDMEGTVDPDEVVHPMEDLTSAGPMHPGREPGRSVGSRTKAMGNPKVSGRTKPVWVK